MAMSRNELAEFLHTTREEIEAGGVTECEEVCKKTADALLSKFEISPKGSPIASSKPEDIQRAAQEGFAGETPNRRVSGRKHAQQKGDGLGEAERSEE